MKTFKQFSGVVQATNLNEALKLKKDDYFAAFIARQTEEFCANVIRLMEEAGYPTTRTYVGHGGIYDRDPSIYFKVTLPSNGTNPEDNVDNTAPGGSTIIRFSASRETVYCNLVDSGSQSIGMLVKKLDKAMRTKK